jgi:hypothetical protein
MSQLPSRLLLLLLGLAGCARGGKPAAGVYLLPRSGALPLAPSPWSSPFLPTLPAWLAMPNDGIPPTPEEWARYAATGNKSHLSLWSTVAQQEAFELYWSPLARAAVLSGTDAAADTAALRRWALVAAHLQGDGSSSSSSSAFALADLLTLGCLSNARFLAHAVAMVQAYRCSAGEAARFLLFHALTAAPLSLLAASLALGSLRRGAAALLALVSLPLLLAAGPLGFAALTDARLVAAAAFVGALAAALH